MGLGWCCKSLKTALGARKHQVIGLSRRRASSSGSTRLRMAEDLKFPHLSATLGFKVTGMVQGDQIEVQINGQSIPAVQIERTYDADGQSENQGRPLPAFYLYRIPLSSPPAVFGDNELQLRLTGSAGGENLVAQEFEIFIRQPEVGG